jgi:hypothetical protein
MSRLSLPPISIDWDVIDSTAERWPFDRLGWELVARAGQLCEQVVDATGLGDDAGPRELTIDEAVIGGLFVRMTKLLRGLFDASQSDESEVHQIVARCIVETAVNIRWLLQQDNPEEYKRFRADSFVTWRKLLGGMGQTGDDVLDSTAERVQRNVEGELKAAGLAWEDIPKRPGSWGRGKFRQRLVDLDLDLGGLYDPLFATHSYYVHGSWHELRTFHLKTVDGGIYLDPTYGELAPTTSYEVVVASLQAACDYAGSMPMPSELAADVVALAEPTIKACHRLSAAFAGYISRGGLDDLLERHLPK